MKLRTFAPLGVLTLSLLIGAGALATYARQGDAASDQMQGALNRRNIACVDMEQVFEASDAPGLELQKDRDIDIHEMDEVDRIGAVPYLNQQDLKEFIEIVIAPAPTPAQEARAKELKEKSDASAQQLNALAQKQAPDANDKHTMADLNQLSAQNQSLMPRIEEELDNDAKIKKAAFHREQMRRLREIVGKVAASKGVVDVWDTESLAYSANDITPEVIRKFKSR